MQSTIAKDIGVSTMTVKRAIRKLAVEKLLLIESKGQRGRRRAVNRYSLIHPSLGIMGVTSAK